MANVRSEFRIGLKDETARGVASINRSLDSLKSKALVIGAGITASAGIFGVLIKQSADLADELGKTAQRAGVTVEALSGLQYAAKLSDVDLGALSGGLQKLARTMSDAARGSSIAVDAFGALGIAFVDSTGRLRQTDVVFAEIADKFSKLPDGATKTALAMQLLGRSGAQMIPLLNAGADGLEAYRKEAESLGLIIDTKTSKAAEEFNDNLTRINAALQGISLQLAGPVINALSGLSTEFLRAYTEGEGLLRVFTALGSAISRVVQGSDAERMGKLMLEEMELVRKIAEVRKTQWGDMRSGEIIQMETRLKSVRAEMEGLRTVMQPAELGAAPAAAPVARPTIAEPVLAASKAVGEASKAAERATAALQRESDSVRAFLQDYARERESAFQQEVDASKARMEQLAEAIATPRERALRELAEYEQVFGASSEEYGRKAVEVFNQLETEIDDTIETSKDLEKTFADLGATFSSAFEDAILNGEKFSDVLVGLGKDIARLLLRATVTDPLASIAGDILKSGSVGGGIADFFKGLFSNSRGGLYKVAGSGGGERPVAFTAQPGEMVAVGRPGSGGGGITVINVGAAPSRTERRQVNGKRQLVQFFSSTAYDAASEGALASLGLPPPLVAR